MKAFLKELADDWQAGDTKIRLLMVVLLFDFVLATAVLVCLLYMRLTF